jgi:ABC-type amino acid transport substrate-binding protein
MNRYNLRTISIFLFLILITATLTFLSSTVSAFAAGGAGSALTPKIINSSARPLTGLSQQRIRIAQVDFPNFYYNDSYGSLGGYGYDYLQEIAAYTGWEYEFVRVSPEQGFKMLENGEVDLMAPVIKTPDLQNRLDFSGKEVGLDYSILCVSVENTVTAYNDFTAIDGMRVGLLANDPANDTLASYEKANGFEVNVIMFYSRDELLKSLQRGDIDAILTCSLEKVRGNASSPGLPRLRIISQQPRETRMSWIL